ncbi:MAG TPA: immunoglobulin domain-containing protein [Phycisphaerales bacterium]
MDPRRTVIALSVLAGLFGAVRASAQISQQCEGWLPGFPVQEIPSPSASTVWDRDGDGPEEPMLIIAAPISSIETIIGWNGERWVSITSVGGSIGPISRLFVYNNKLHAFTGRLYTFEVNQWVETAVAPVRPTINDLTIFNNEIVIAGGFANENGVYAFRSGAWVRIGAAFNAQVSSVDVWNGTLVAAGYFFRGVAAFDGTSWTSIGSVTPSTSYRIRSAGSALVLGTPFGSTLSVYSNGSWDNGSSGQILDRVNGRVYVTNSSDRGILRAFDGTTWTTLDSASRQSSIPGGNTFTIKALAWYRGRLHAAGDVTSNRAFTRTLEYVGTTWRPFGEGPGGRLRSVLAGPDGVVYVSDGARSSTGIVSVDYPYRPFVRRWDGTRFAPVGPAFEGRGLVADSTRLSSVYRLQWDPEFGLLAVGFFYGNNGVPITAVARNVGDEWLPVGGPLPSITDFASTRAASVYRLVRYRGELLAFGIVNATPGMPSSGVVRYLNGQWVEPDVALRVPYSYANLQDAIVFDDKLFVAGGIGDTDGTLGTSAYYDGLAWSKPDNSVDSLTDFCVHNNELYATSRDSGTTDTFYVTRWTGSGWQRLPVALPGPGGPLALASYKGSLYVGGEFGLRSWNGSAWQFRNPPSFGGAIYDLVVHAGELIAVGNFRSLNPSENFLRFSSNGIPAIASHPQSRAGSCGENVTLRSTAASGYPTITYKWFRDGSPLSDGVTPHGSILAGSGTDTLRISNLRPEDAGSYTCSLTDRCGTATTSPAAISASCCPADLDQNGAVADEDFQIFAAAYDLVLCASPSMPAGCPADFTADTIVDDADFAIFVTAYDRRVCP